MSQTEIPTREYVANLIYPVGSVIILDNSKTPNGVGIPFTWSRRNFAILNKVAGKALDVSAGSNKDGANVDVFQPNYSNAQLWWFVLYSASNGERQVDMWVRTA
jgi:hypothetical protein